MIDFTLDTGEALADDLRELEREAPRRVFRRITREIIPPLERLMDRRLRLQPPPRTPASPRFIWSHDPEKNARARRWFFANYPNGYTRTGALVQAWETAIEFDAGITRIEIENPARGASYVFGSDEFDQVPGHKTTGWPLVASVATEIGAELEDDIEELWETIVDTFI